MSQHQNRTYWFAAGWMAGAVTAALCAWLGNRHARLAPEQPAFSQDAGRATQSPALALATSHERDGGSDVFEYRGFVVHLFWQAQGPERYRAWCDIWEAGAVVQESGGPPATFLSAAEARLAAGAWARHWVQNNG